MNREQYIRLIDDIRKFSIAITLFVIAYLLETNKIEIISNEVTIIISSIFSLISYYLLLHVAKILKKKEIHGMTNVVFTGFYLRVYNLLNIDHSCIILEIFFFIAFILSVYILIDGFIRLFLSFVFIIINNKNEEKLFESIEAVVAIITSIVSLIVSAL